MEEGPGPVMGGTSLGCCCSTIPTEVVIGSAIPISGTVPFCTFLVGCECFRKLYVVIPIDGSFYWLRGRKRRSRSKSRSGSRVVVVVIVVVVVVVGLVIRTGARVGVGGGAGVVVFPYLNLRSCAGGKIERVTDY